MSKVDPGIIGLNKPQSTVDGKYQIGQAALLLGLTNAQLRSCMPKLQGIVEFINDRFYFDSAWVDQMTKQVPSGAIRCNDWYPKQRWTAEEKARIKAEKAVARKASWKLPIEDAKRNLAIMICDNGSLLVGPAYFLQNESQRDKYFRLLKREAAGHNLEIKEYLEANHLTPTHLKELERVNPEMHFMVGPMSVHPASTQFLIEYFTNYYVPYHEWTRQNTPLLYFVFEIVNHVLPLIQSNIFQTADNYINIYGHQLDSKDLQPEQRRKAQEEIDAFITPFHGWKVNLDRILQNKFNDEERPMILEALRLGWPRLAKFI